MPKLYKGTSEIFSLACGTHNVKALYKGNTQIWGDKIVSYVRVGNIDYPYVKVGSRYWIAENLVNTWSGLTIGSSSVPKDSSKCAWYYNDDEATYKKEGLYYNMNAVQYIKSNLLPQGWRVPTKSDFESLLSISPLDLLSKDLGGNDTLGLSLGLCGRVGNERMSGSALVFDKTFLAYGMNGEYWSETHETTMDSIKIYWAFFIKTSQSFVSDQWSPYGMKLRLCKDA